MFQNAEKLEISSVEAIIKNIIIFDSCGKIISSRYGNATNSVSFAIAQFRKGLYVVQVDGQRFKIVL